MTEELKKGDFVVTGEGFPAIVMDNMKRSNIRMVHAFGIAEESGSTYAEGLRKISQEEFEELKTEMFKRFGHANQWSSSESAKQRKKLEAAGL
jgi:hypothetical protein